MAKKLSVSYVCQECGYDSPAFMGKCPECGLWNTFREIKHPSSTLRAGGSDSVKPGLRSDSKPKTLDEITVSEKERIGTGFSEMDGVLGGGIVRGSVILLAGDPGVGKSTLLLQSALHAATKTQGVVLYVSGEESEEQIKLRASRIHKGAFPKNLLLVSMSDTNEIVNVISESVPSLVVIDSIQTMQSADVASLSGSVGQVRYAAASFIQVAKSKQIPIILVGHVTKEGMVAGPMVLSHMVDTVLFFEGEKLTATRILRSLKNRFGPVDEVGVFTMVGDGISEVKNPEQIFLTNKTQNTPGSVLSVIQEGTRSFLIELQALVVSSKLPMPRRVAAGVDGRRLELLLAVLQKHCRLPFESYDVFVNIAGGMKVTDPAVDLGICLALFSSLKNVALKKTVGIAEVGLLGELRGVPYLEKRMKEAKALGLTNIITHKTYSSIRDVIQSVQA